MDLQGTKIVHLLFAKQHQMQTQINEGIQIDVCSDAEQNPQSMPEPPPESA